jgi:energy-converting hydrogenase Eha subunit A
MLLAVAEVVGQVIAVVLRSVEALVLDLPVSAAASPISATFSGVIAKPITKALE